MTLISIIITGVQLLWDSISVLLCLAFKFVSSWIATTSSSVKTLEDTCNGEPDGCEGRTWWSHVANRIVRCRLWKCIRWRVFLSPHVCSVSTTESHIMMLHRQTAQSLPLPLWNIDSYSVDDVFPFSTHFEIWLTWRNSLFSNMYPSDLG